jgi:flagellar biosynthesis/type III secretory pathway protein FliH
MSATAQERQEAERRIRYVREVNAIKDYHWDEGRAQGKAEGKAEGIELGTAKGRAEATKDLLIRMLERKFGPLCPEHQTQLNSASPVQLEAYFDAALTASTAKEVFAQ